MRARKSYREHLRPKPPERFVDTSCRSVGPMGCGPPAGINLIGAALTAAEMAKRLAAGKEIGSMFVTDPNPTEYQLYQMAKHEREAREAEKAVIRLLGQDGAQKLPDIGLDPGDLGLIRTLAGNRNGIVIVTGPTIAAEIPPVISVSTTRISISATEMPAQIETRLATSANPIQTGVVAGTIDPTRAAVLQQLDVLHGDLLELVRQRLVGLRQPRAAAGQR